VLKINRDELMTLTKQPTAHEAASLLLRGADARLTRPNAAIAVTDGPRPAMLFRRARAWRLAVPAVPCVNPIGAGDVCTGVFAHQLAAGDDTLAAFAWGLAAASARVMERSPTFATEKATELHAALVIEPIDSWADCTEES
jgi:sugar/nucleoside kinase (ribokinase family)